MIVPVVRSAIPLQSLSDQARFIHYMTGADTSTVSIWVSYARSLLQHYFASYWRWTEGEEERTVLLIASSMFLYLVVSILDFLDSRKVNCDI